MNRKNVNIIINTLIVFALIFSMLAGSAGSVQARREVATANIHPALAQIAAESPDEMVRIIVQKVGDGDQAERYVASLGGEVLKDLHLINAFSAQMPAKDVSSLAKLDTVGWVGTDNAVRSTSLMIETLRDEFNSISYSNNDGTAVWAGDWQEINESDGPGSGDEQIVSDSESNRLRVRDNEGGGEGLTRQADLSGATAATLSFDFRRVGLDRSSDYIALAISTDGDTWVEIDRFAGPATDSSYQARSYDISAYLSDQTTIRLLSSSRNGGKDLVYFDNVKIEYNIEYTDDEGASSVEMGEVYTVRDEFSSGDFSGSDGFDAWAGIWVEVDPGDVVQSPTSGYVQMVNGELRINNENPQYVSSTVTRAVNLNRTTSAALSFDYRTSSGVTTPDGIAVEVSPDNGANWILLDILENISGATSGSKSYDISPFATASTLIRFRVAYFYGFENQYFYVDNLEIAYTYDGEVPMRANLQTIADDFNIYPYNYSSSSGTDNWLTDWLEIDDDGLPLSGDVHMTNVLGRRAFSIWTDDDENWQPTRGIQRSADISGATWAEISFLYSRGTMEVGDFLFVEASTDDGATWTEVGRIEGKGAAAVTSSDQGWRYAGFDLGNFISANTAIRLVLTDFHQNNNFDSLYIDDLKISFHIPTGNLTPNYYLETLNVQPVWDMGYDGSGVTVAVVDSGIALDYDFNTVLGEANSDRLLTQVGFNQDSVTVHDAFGHGTHVAGIIAGNGNGADGYYQGVAPGANLIGLKVSDDLGMAYESDTVAALQWVFDHKDQYNIRVVNLSIQSTVEQYYYESALNAAAEILWFNGVVVVASAGNQWSGEYFNTVRAAPANDPFIITVGASNEQGNADRADDLITPFTARGLSFSGYYKPEIIAPGKDIISTLAGSSEWRNDHPDRFVEGGYFRISGTSMAAPMVAGAAALLLQAEPDLTPDQVKYRLVSTSTLIEYHPYLDIYAALTAPTTEAYNWNVVPHQLLAKMAMIAYWASVEGEENIDWENVDWDAVNWDAVNWNAVNWDAVNWNAVNWNAVNWNAVNWNAVNWNAVNWNAVNWNAVNWNAVNWNAVNWNAVNWDD